MITYIDTIKMDRNVKKAFFKPFKFLLPCLFLLFSGSSIASTVLDSSAESNNYVAQTVMPLVANELMTVVGDGIGEALGMGGFGSSMRGQSSGDYYQDGQGVWFKIVGSGLKSTRAGGNYDGHQVSGMFGLDYTLDDTMLFGIAISMEDLDITTSYNSGSFEGDGVSIFPYAGIKLRPNLLLNLMVGYSYLGYDTTRNGGITGKFKGQRFLNQAELRANYMFGNLQIQPSMELSYFHEVRDSYTESDNTYVPGNSISVGQYGTGLTASYRLDRMTPYLRLRATHNFVQSEVSTLTSGEIYSPEKFDYSIALGNTYQISDSLNFVVEGAMGALNQSDLSTWSLTSKIRFEW